MAYLEITENNLKIGEVLSIRTDNGKTLKALQMLIGDKTKATISRDTENNCAVFKVEDTDIADLPSFECNIKKETIRDMLSGLKEFYNLLEDEK